MKYKTEKSEHKKLLKMLGKHFHKDEEDLRGEDDEYNLHDQEMFDRNGFGDPMDTFVVEGNTRQNHENDYDEGDEFDDNDNGDYDQDEDDDEDARAKKEDRKKMSIMTLSKKI